LNIEKELKELIQKVINFSIIGNNKQQNELKNIMNVPHPYPATKEIINLEKNNSEEYNLYPEKSQKIQAITNKIERSLINNMFLYN